MRIQQLIKAHWEYHLINLLVFLIILGLFVWLAFFNSPIQCIYVSEGLSCKSCGLTTAFQAMLGGEFTSVNSSFKSIFIFFAIQLLIRPAISILILLQAGWIKFIVWMDGILFSLFCILLFHYFILA